MRRASSFLEAFFVYLIMKKIFTFLLIVLASKTFAQSLPNASFENWTNLIFFYEPQGYVTTNYASILLGGGSPRANVSRATTIKGTGTYGAKLESYAINQGDTSGVPGAMLTGSLDLANASIKPGFSYSGRPDEMKALYNYTMGNRLDSGVITVLFTKYDSIAGPFNLVGVGVGFLQPSPNSDMQEITIPILYTQEINPDTAVIVISTSSAFSGSFDTSIISSAPVGSILYVDDLQFISPVGIEKIDNLIQANAYPNPTTSAFVVNFYIAESSNAKIQLMSTDGRIVYADAQALSKGNQELKIATDGIAQGLYLLKIETSLGTIQKQIVIQ